jgi:triacylglycerol lipase
MHDLLKVLYFTAADWLYIYVAQITGLFKRGKAYDYSMPKNPTGIAVVIIPGIYEPWQFMLPLTRRLFSAGHPIYIVEGLGYNVGSIPKMAEIVRDYIAKLPVKEVAIVAHSKGGLIAKYLLANYNQNDRVKQAVTLNTPFSGSIYAAFAPIWGVRVFSPRSKLLRQLLLNAVVNARITSVYSRYDANIPEGSFLQGATNIKIDTIGHFRIIKNEQAQNAVIQALAPKA